MTNGTLGYTKRCPSCGTLVDDYLSSCPNCNYQFQGEKYGVIHSYGPSSATAYTSSFNAIADEFDDDLNAKKSKEEILKPDLDENILSSYVNWGYLDHSEDKYTLTPLGKETYFKNREYEKKKKKSKEKPENE